jgi:glucuronoarabinoxylan endo-1,4-beta-xylanase
MAAMVSASLVACVQSAGTRQAPAILPVQVVLGTQHQVIAGFGASSAWTAPSLTDAEADEFFSTNAGIGLSLLRVRITPEGTTDELATAQSAAAHGVAVWAAPWSPPAEWMSPRTASDGGAAGPSSLIPEDAQAWADRLAGFAATMASSGVPLAALSAQNEPNYYTTSWDTCVYSSTDLAAFIGNDLGPALAARGLSTPILAPETQGWDNFAKFADPILADAQSAMYVAILATHDYAGFPFVYAPARAAGKQVWETEVTDGMPGSDPGIDSGLRVAKLIHDHLVNGEVNAWHYWWLKPRTDTPPDNGALTTADGHLARRAYALGNWSRFVRPGFVRIDATSNPQTWVYVSAFADPASGRVVIVAINQASVDLAQVFSIPDPVLADATPWITSADLALAPADPVPVVNAGFTYTLPKRSVTTFVGDP